MRKTLFAMSASRNFSERDLWKILTRMLDQYPPRRSGQRPRY